jgi:hypothetical protein
MQENVPFERVAAPPSDRNPIYARVIGELGENLTRCDAFHIDDGN